MSTERYWVIGGDYSCMAFKALRNGQPPEVVGPFDTHEAAKATWRRLAEETRACATARYSIAAEQIVLPN